MASIIGGIAWFGRTHTLLYFRSYRISMEWKKKECSEMSEDEQL
jgi:hypothetical protein